MADIRAYILSIVISSLICGCVQNLVGNKSSATKLIQVLCGVYMTFVLFSPMQNIDLSFYQDYYAGFSASAQEAVAKGKIVAEEKLTQIIKERTESYILEKASSLGAEIVVEITLSGDAMHTPSAITIKGAVSPYVKKVLMDYIAEQFGIPEEAQTWKQNTV